MLRLKLHLGHAGDVLQPLKRELTTHVQMPVPPLWERGLKLIIRALEDELQEPSGRDPQRYSWVQTQILHPADERRCTLNHPVARQAEILWDWAQRLDQDGDPLRAMELLERLLLLAPHHVPALSWLCSLLRGAGMMEETLAVAERWLAAQPGETEALLRRGEALLSLGRPQEAQEAFAAILKGNPVHPLAHLGAAQAKGLLGGDPLPHLDAALELDREGTLSVLRETFDFRVIARVSGEATYTFEELPELLGVTQAEVRAFITQHGLPAEANGVREPELSRWVGIQNRYQLLPFGLHWSAPTPRFLPELE